MLDADDRRTVAVGVIWLIALYVGVLSVSLALALGYWLFVEVSGI